MGRRIAQRSQAHHLWCVCNPGGDGILSLSFTTLDGKGNLYTVGSLSGTFSIENGQSATVESGFGGVVVRFEP